MQGADANWIICVAEPGSPCAEAGLPTDEEFIVTHVGNLLVQFDPRILMHGHVIHS